MCALGAILPPTFVPWGFWPNEAGTQRGKGSFTLRAHSLVHDKSQMTLCKEKHNYFLVCSFVEKFCSHTYKNETIVKCNLLKKNHFIPK